jgi:hypothetical protein
MNGFGVDLGPDICYGRTLASAGEVSQARYCFVKNGTFEMCQLDEEKRNLAEGGAVLF